MSSERVRRSGAQRSQNVNDDYVLSNFKRLHSNFKRHRLDRHHRPSDLRYGHRGETRLPWRCGPRESPLSRGGAYPQKQTTLFIDHLPYGVSINWIGDTFAEFGKVMDVYLSKKVRKSCKDMFGFVRFNRYEEAVEAVKNMNDFAIKGMKLCVSLAKYDRMGRAIQGKPIESDRNKHRKGGKQWIIKPAFRDHRNYADVVMGKKKPVMELVKNVKPAANLQKEG
ncbi:unnamed protein product [Amaranthus hypochondriacus]